ncbi:MAG: ion transporter [Desulfobacterales bacterium]|nr:ion transporter [Desulfobacterales bacterium]
MIKLLIAEKTVLTMIILNALVMFLDAFPGVNRALEGWPGALDHLFLLYFIFEISAKIVTMGFRTFWARGWNRFDFIIVLASTPVLFSFLLNSRMFSVLLVLRLCRLLRFLRVLSFIPHRDQLLKGVVRALKASVGVGISLFFLNFMLSMGATALFGKIVPEYFGNPLLSVYSMFKIFTVEGWYEIPDLVALRSGSLGMALFARLYFILAVLFGGILGLSLANAIFVDEMTVDNTQKLEEMVTELTEEVRALRLDLETRKAERPP